MIGILMKLATLFAIAGAIFMMAVPIAHSQMRPPAGASEELQAAIAAAPAPDIAALRAMTDPDWAAQRDIFAAITPSATELQTMFSVTIVDQEIGGVRVYRITPAAPDARFKDRLFLHVHGGGYVLGGGETGLVEAALIASTSGIETVSIDYRLAPEHPFPAALDDVMKVYRALIEDRAAESIAIGGTSAGGGLALAAIHRMKLDGARLPAAVFAGSPWADLTKTGDTLTTLEGVDSVLGTYDGLLHAAALAYAGDEDLRNPLISPIYGEFAGFPPVLLISGTRDLFLSDTARVQQRLHDAGVRAELILIEGMSHGDYLEYDETPEGKSVFRALKTIFTSSFSPPED